MDLGLAGRKAIVTGGKRGLGYAIAEVLCEEGCDVAICARDDEGVNHAVARLADKGTRVFGAAVDASDADAYKGWIDTAIGQLGGLDVFVHNISGASGGARSSGRRTSSSTCSASPEPSRPSRPRSRTPAVARSSPSRRSPPRRSSPGRLRSGR